MAKSGAEAERGAMDVEQALQIIYHNLRTLDTLPSLRSISRHAENLTLETRTTSFLIRRRAMEHMPALAPLLTRIELGISRCDDIITQPIDFARKTTPESILVHVRSNVDSKTEPPPAGCRRRLVCANDVRA